MVTAVSGVGCAGSTKNTKLLLAAFPKSCTSSTARSSDYASDTWWRISRHQAWSCNAAYNGTEPFCDDDNVPFPVGSSRAARAGQDIAGGLRFVLWGICGDIEMPANHLLLPHWGSSNMCLGRCLCEKAEGPFAFNEFRPAHSLWMQNELTPQYILANHPSEHKHPWFSIIGASILFVHYGVMHVFDQNGCLSRSLACVLFEIIYLQIGGSHSAALALVWRRILELYREINAKYSLSKLTLDMFCNSPGPYQH